MAATALQYNVNDPKFDSDAVVNCVFAQKPDRHTLLGIGAFIWNEPYLQRILSLLRQYRFPGSIVLGGPQISYTTCNPAVYYPTVDIFCRGYAEQAVHKLVTKATCDDPHPIIAWGNSLQWIARLGTAGDLSVRITPKSLFGRDNPSTEIS